MAILAMHNMHVSTLHRTCTKEGNSCAADWNAQVVLKVQMSGQDRGCRRILGSDCAILALNRLYL